MMRASQISPAALVAQCSERQKALVLAELVQHYCSALGTNLPIELNTDSGRVLGYFVPVEIAEKYIADADCEEFRNELQRRGQSRVRRLSVESVRRWLAAKVAANTRRSEHKSKTSANGARIPSLPRSHRPAQQQRNGKGSKGKLAGC
jgi:hypothetical protein